MAWEPLANFESNRVGWSFSEPTTYRSFRFKSTGGGDLFSWRGLLALASVDMTPDLLSLSDVTVIYRREEFQILELTPAPEWQSWRLAFQLLNPKSIYNGWLLNVDVSPPTDAVAFFSQLSPPVTRIDGSPLQEGDRWYKPVDNGLAGTAGHWEWTGALWVTDRSFFHNAGTFINQTAFNNGLGEGNNFGATNTVALSAIPFGFSSTKYLKSYALRISDHITSTNFSDSNYFELYPSIAQSGNVDAFAVRVNGNNIIHTNGQYKESIFPLQTAVNLNTASNAIRFWTFSRNVGGSPAVTSSGNISISQSLEIKGVHP